ncbi:MAG: hypothetical protein HPY66_3617 [Firmicutes bacterium]|nr:hypothetical protein [Bacillota bacterium]MDI6706733.1 sporulation protein YqfD [Bacillota bacterium]
MLVVRVWNFLRGYLIIKVEGLNLERFINLSIANNIFFWDIERINYSTILVKVSLKGYRMLRRIRRRVRCRVSIVEKRGCPFLFHRIMKRKTLAAGAVAAVAIMYLLTSFVWVVDVNGNDRVSEDRIIRELESLGLKPGVFKYTVNARELETALLIKMDQLSWVGINIVGTKALVDVVERVEPPALVDKETPCNILAKKDGLITNVFVFDGTPLVKEGDTVKSGQLLISGVVEKPGFPVRLVHAMGKVEARTWYHGSEEQELLLQKRERTGNTARKIRLRLGRYSIKLTPGDIGYSEYDKTQDIKRLAEWRNIVLPVELIIDNYSEVRVENEELSLEQAKSMAVQRIEERLAGIVPEDAKIVDRSIKYYGPDGGRIRVEMVLETLEDIGMEEKIILGRTEY